MKKYKTLIVEDEVIIAMFLKAILKKHNFEIVNTVSTGMSAVEAVKQYKPDIIFMDIFLKDDMDGIAAAAAVRLEHPCKIIFLTANADSSTKKAALEMEPFAYFQKPVSEQMIYEISEKLKQEQPR